MPQRPTPDPSAATPAGDGLTMSDDALDFADYIAAHGLQAEIVAPGTHMPTVDTAAAAMGVPPEQIFKSILFQSPAGRCVMVVASGNARVDVRRVESLTGIVNLKLAKPAVVFAKTGYPAGGTPPVGHRERVPVIVDTRVAAQPWGYAGGGRAELLVRIQSADIVRLAGAMVADVIAKDHGTM
ncbi:MAG: Cys-tRNA(Pro) deacylase [candidate division NC10 bacterium]|nr:Cys-tRNA(Pro) deacylase [candidate division NC10 bacterium]MBS1116331.1 Cys-tRNA(Pro) deacylase [candidate division NC10 bacterium]